MGDDLYWLTGIYDRGLTLIAPTKVLDMVQQLVGKDLGFQMENDGVASIAQSGP